MDLANYLVPVNADVADLDAISVEEDDLHVTSTGRSRGLAPLRRLSTNQRMLRGINLPLYYLRSQYRPSGVDILGARIQRRRQPGRRRAHVYIGHT